jgi:uncharacterized protein YbjT (DUF2867 family)
MTTSILLTGGTGRLGSRLVPLLVDGGAQVRVLSRGTRAPAAGVELATGDLTTGEGVEAAVTGTDVVVHCAGTTTGDDAKARTLVEAARRAGVRHLVHISVVGADRVPVVSRVDRAMFGYFESKLATERVVAESGLPWTTLRTTQFHDLVLTTVRGLTKLPVAPVPSGMPAQPVDTGDVAARMAELAFGAPSGLVQDLAGPRVYDMAELVRGYLRAQGRRRLLVPVRMFGRAGRAVREGALLGSGAALGRGTWEEFLAERVGTPAPGSIR